MGTAIIKPLRLIAPGTSSPGPFGIAKFQPSQIFVTPYHFGFWPFGRKVKHWGVPLTHLPFWTFTWALSVTTRLPNSDDDSDAHVHVEPPDGFADNVLGG
jgi:hypothetical protein